MPGSGEPGECDAESDRVNISRENWNEMQWVGAGERWLFPIFFMACLAFAPILFPRLHKASFRYKENAILLVTGTVAGVALYISVPVLFFLREYSIAGSLLVALFVSIMATFSIGEYVKLYRWNQNKSNE